jgi:hypothetical protein
MTRAGWSSENNQLRNGEALSNDSDKGRKCKRRCLRGCDHGAHHPEYGWRHLINSRDRGNHERCKRNDLFGPQDHGHDCREIMTSAGIMVFAANTRIAFADTMVKTPATMVKFRIEMIEPIDHAVFADFHHGRNRIDHGENRCNRALCRFLYAVRSFDRGVCRCHHGRHCILVPFILKTMLFEFARMCFVASTLVFVYSIMLHGV